MTIAIHAVLHRADGGGVEKAIAGMVGGVVDSGLPFDAGVFLPDSLLNGLTSPSTAGRVRLYRVSHGSRPEPLLREERLVRQDKQSTRCKRRGILHSPKMTTVCIVNASEHVFGAEKSMAYLAGALSGEGRRFCLVSPGGATERLFRSVGVTEAYRLPLRRLATSRNPIRLVRQAAAWLVNSFRFLRLCRAKRPAIIHANGLQAMLHVVAAALVLRIPVVWHVRDAAGPRWCLRLCAAVATVRIHPSQASLTSFPASRARAEYVPNPIFPPAEMSNPSQSVLEVGAPGRMIDGTIRMAPRADGEFRVGLVGQMIPRKGHDLLLDAFPEVLCAIHCARLLFVGDDPFDPDSEYVRRLRHAIEAMPELHGRVAFLGYREDVEEVYVSLDVLAVPSREEPFGRVVVEAMACGCPVVASAVGGLAEVVQDRVNGLLFAPDDRAGLARCIVELGRDHALRESVVANGLLTAEAYRGNLRQVCDRMASIYRGLAPAGKGTKTL
jgi:glycosyltransferase involved in cell wall biosynthesis